MMSTSVQRECENQDEVRNKTGGHHLTRAVYGNTGYHI